MTKMIMEEKEISCEPENCSHYINKKTLHLYKGKFLFSIISCTICIIGLFFLYQISYSNSQNKIISINKENCDNITNKYLKSLTLTKDSTICLDKVVIDIIDENQKESLSLLELQYNRIQNEFIILSLWAGILMIVFLIFSIYSMFKIDEMQKQGREHLNRMEDFSTEAKETSKSIEEQATSKIADLRKNIDAEMAKLSSESKKQLDELQTKINELQKTFENAVSATTSDFENSVTAKTKEFETSVQQYKNMIEASSKRNEELFTQLVNAIRDSGSNNKDEKEEEE